jgi:hypothetical protein
MKRILRPAALLLALLLLVTMTGCDGVQRKKAFVNQYLQGVEYFSFGTEEEGEGVQASGTVFVQKNVKENDATATITAHIRRGESHGEGITVYVAKGWFVNKVLTDFPGNGNYDDSFNMTNIVKTADSGSTWSYMIQIGCDRNQNIPDGAEGTVVIQMIWDYKAVGPTEFATLCAVGAGYSDANSANGVTSVMINIPLQ